MNISHDKCHAHSYCLFFDKVLHNFPQLWLIYKFCSDHDSFLLLSKIARIILNFVLFFFFIWVTISFSLKMLKVNFKKLLSILLTKVQNWHVYYAVNIFIQLWIINFIIVIVQYIRIYFVIDATIYGNPRTECHSRWRQNPSCLFKNSWLIEIIYIVNIITAC